jgi:pSer/pThr/pTyr-binding forkhead associated (FHA) protein
MTAAAAPARAPAAAPVPGPVSTSAEGRLVLIRPDGSEGESFPLKGETIVGRNAAGPFASDSYMSPQHATFRFTQQGLFVDDMQSLNGVYMRIAPDAPSELEDGAVFRIGQEIIRFERLAAPARGPNGEDLMGSPDPGYLGRIRLVVGKDLHGSSYCIPPEGMHLGRERGDIIFPDDGYVSGLHCRIHGDAERVFLTDVGSSNGTFVRLHGQCPVAPGSLLLMGQQLFRVIY